MSICKNCGKDIPLDHAQVGGVHMDCEHEYFHLKNQPMIKMKSINGGPWCIVTAEEAVEMTLDSGDDESYETRLVLVMMSKGEIAALPEFTGW